MEKAIEKEFFKAFRLTVSMCIGWMRQKYDLGFYPQDSNQQNNDQEQYYGVELPNAIRREVESFDDTVIKFVDSPLMDEIEENLRGCKDQSDRENYIYSLLRPFKEYSDIFYPITTISQLEHEIERTRRDIKIWKSCPSIKDCDGHKVDIKGEIDACCEDMKECKGQIERINYISKRFLEILNETSGFGTVERCLRSFHRIAGMFANRLDALLLMNGMDFFSYQKKIGIYLTPERSFIGVAHHIGSYELAQRYITELPDKKQEVGNDVSEATKYTGIANKLSKWITGADDEVLESIILNNKIPEGKIKPEWVGSKAEAHRFKIWIGATEKPMTKCFRGLDNKNFRRSGSPKTESDVQLGGSIWDILKRYPDPKQK